VSTDAATVDIPLASAAVAPLKKFELSENEKSTKSDKKLWLWAALAGGLLLLAGMAWSLFKGMGKVRDETK
jgi:hypothetical protein